MNKRNSFSPRYAPDNRLEILSKENASLGNTMKMVSDAQEAAIQTTLRMSQQMSTLENANDKMTSIISSIPYIGNLANNIQIKRKRDRLILGSLIGFLMFFVVWYLFG